MYLLCCVDALRLEKPSGGQCGLCANAQPVLGTLNVNLDVVFAHFARVIVPQGLNVPTVSGTTDIGDHDAVVGVVFGAKA